jgi:hypothetical protein
MSDVVPPHDPAAAQACLDEADRIHDERPEAGLALLQDIAPAALPIAARGRFAFLANHVAGEKFGRWDEALALQHRVVQATAGAMTTPLWRHAAVAARLAGEASLEARWCSAFAASANAAPGEAEAVVELAAASFVLPRQADAAQAARTALAALASCGGIDRAATSPLALQFAIASNNLATHLAEQRPLSDLTEPALCDALRKSAALSVACWASAGTWVQQERSRYLGALAANALGDGRAAAVHARAGLALLDAHDEAHAEDVDRAFLELELAQGLRLDGADGAPAARDRAETLAAAFKSPGLRTWFEDRRRRNEEILVHYCVDQR